MSDRNKGDSVETWRPWPEESPEDGEWVVVSIDGGRPRMARYTAGRSVWSTWSDGDGLLPPEWWLRIPKSPGQYEREDRERLRLEALAKRAQLRAEADAQLTPAEREALGL